MVSSLEVALRAERAELSLPATGSSSKVVRVAFPLLYSGSAPSKVLAFAAASSGEAVELELSYPDVPSPWKGVLKLTGARLELPNGTQAADGGKPRVRLLLVLSREDTREARELLAFLLDAAHAQVLELDARARIVQPQLPFDGEDGEPEEDGGVEPGDDPIGSHGLAILPSKKKKRRR